MEELISKTNSLTLNEDENGRSIMEEMLATTGLQHIIKHISGFLDAKSLASCRLVSQSWRDMIDNHRLWLIFQLEYIHGQKKRFIRRYEDVDFTFRDECRIGLFHKLELETEFDSNSQLKPTTIRKLFPKWSDFAKEIPTRMKSIGRLKEFTRQMWIYFKDQDVDYVINPLAYAVKKSNAEFVKLLINAGIDLFMRLPNEATIIHIACRFGNVEMVELILENAIKSDATLEASYGWTIFHYLAFNEDHKVVKLILDTFRYKHKVVFTEDGIHFTMIQLAVAFGSKETIEFLLQSQQMIEFNIEERGGENSKTILHTACKKRDIEIVDLVIDSLEKIGSDINLDTLFPFSCTAFHDACMNKTSDVAIQLLKRFPQKIHSLGTKDKHVLHYACMGQNLPLLEYIFGNSEFDIDFNVVDSLGMTPLHLACSNIFVVKLFMKHAKEKGIDITKKDKWGRTARRVFLQFHNYAQGYGDILELFDQCATDQI